MMNYSAESLKAVRESIEHQVKQHVLAARIGHRDISPKDQWLVSVYVLKHADTWQYNAHVIFGKVAMSEKMDSNFIKVTPLVLNKAHFLDIGEAMNMTYLKKREKCFLHHLFAL